MRGVTVLDLEVVLCLGSERLSLSPRCTTALKLRRPGSTTGGGDLLMSSKSPDTGGTVEEIADGKATVNAGVELLDGSKLDLILSGVSASEVMDDEPSFRPSVEVMILDEGNRVTDGASERVDEITEELA